MGELKDTLHCILSFVKERDALSQSDLKSFVYKDRLNGEDITFERERQRDRVNLHNFYWMQCNQRRAADIELWGWFRFARKTYIQWHKEAACS